MSRLHIDSITKSYKNKVILSDVFISCEKGEIKGLIGRNGSGKSTLLKIIFGTEKPKSKFIKVGDKIIKNISDGRGLINYLPQHSFLPNNISVRSIINLFLQKENREIVLKNEYVKSLLNKNSQVLSSGERRLVEILLIIHSSAKFILLDEPFSGVSPIIREYLIEYIRKFKTSKGFIITDHNYENVINLADNIMYLQNGVLKKINDKSELIELGYISDAVYNDIYN
ncbi:ATP-binding cassette domain-containing protein [Tenacibaculum finnmarkense]|uniref:ATP-binding cassette domain-containing protein n=1 Tax=Tenacibaculum finnmarkense TaxID=2781243 RepID=UPI001EFB9F1C|nr:ATP-binding cassette domain-containing protein [Tenacibaculum finnmarkense]MCG8207463.1 ABC transporter ATP-binding protein [Tenacibaculum finnmarkense genomovar finnmarkense]MCG8723574.1 ABC transporter ATP-binding protein [Tenacibaculum finnmarkense]MCG8741492.1 ABC transporter ATP-binding protein [Tenacibaculum finnmarkense]MCG8765226.1 ABC transporter ATP-binding protein [Tenacibaculum finnmarkense]MCG8778044.1 ABC transporter ATP-binding protein [Tenacibaculum finnmarkense]